MAATAELREISPPWGPQKQFIKSGAVFKKYQGGQGSGKTVAGVFEIRRYIKRHAGAIVICTEPTYPMVRDILKVEFDRQFAAAGEADLVTWTGGEHKYRLANGSEIWLRQCDKEDALRGPSVAAVWMDEAAQSPYGAFRILVGRVRQQGYPALIMVTGTPRGRNWFHWVFTPGERPDDAPPYLQDILEAELPEMAGQGAVASFEAAAIDNPYLPPITRANLLAAYRVGTLLHQQEVLGKAVVFEGLIYKQFDYERHVRELPGRPVVTVAGVDWGWTKPGVILVLSMYPDGAMAVREEVYETEKQPAWWAAEAVRLRDACGILCFFCDPSEPDNIALMAEHVAAEAANNAVIPGITLVAGAFNDGLLYVSPECPRTISELQSYSWKERKGEVRNDEPEKVGDHAMDALRYARMGLHELPRRAVSTTIRLVEPVRI